MVKFFYFGMLFIVSFAQEEDYIQKCSRNSHCLVGQCCRDSSNRIITSPFEYYPEIEWWRNQVGNNPGNCSSTLAQEGESCDVFCTCEEGLLCTPNILCRSCGNICMSSEVVTKLIQYYDGGCNCLPHNYWNPLQHLVNKKVKIRNGFVQIP